MDGIYPANPEDGLVKNKMETLTYYAVTSPEKLDRIGEYLEHRVGRDIYRNRKRNVFHWHGGDGSGEEEAFSV